MYWTQHAREQFNKRMKGIVSREDVERVIKAKSSEIASVTEWQAIVVVRQLRQRMSVAGSQGRFVVVAIDPADMGIKTVMLREDWQISQKRTNGKLIK